MTVCKCIIFEAEASASTASHSLNDDPNVNKMIFKGLAVNQICVPSLRVTDLYGDAMKTKRFTVYLREPGKVKGEKGI